MTEKNKDDIFYVCSMMEYIGRKTKNRRSDVIRHFSRADVEKQLKSAEVNHCLPFEQVSDELIEDFNIENGSFDTVKEAKYSIPSATEIGSVYQRLVLDTNKGDPAQGIINVFSSFILDEISDYNASTYYRSPGYLSCSYRAGQLME